MAYNYLDLTNEVLARFNEVPLTSSTFNSSRGFQTQCKNAVNDALNYINQREFNWPFNHATETEVLVSGTARYTIPANAKTVDYETFRIVRDESLGTDGKPLRSSLQLQIPRRSLNTFVELLQTVRQRMVTSTGVRQISTQLILTGLRKVLLRCRA